jgi:hypothetical protein
MHIYCLGEGSPTVILDSANMGTVSNWALIQPELAMQTTAVVLNVIEATRSGLPLQ